MTTVSIRMEDAAAPKRWLYAKFMALAQRVGADLLNGAPVGVSTASGTATAALTGGNERQPRYRVRPCPTARRQPRPGAAFWSLLSVSWFGVGLMARATLWTRALASGPRTLVPEPNMAKSAIHSFCRVMYWRMAWTEMVTARLI